MSGMLTRRLGAFIGAVGLVLATTAMTTTTATPAGVAAAAGTAPAATIWKLLTTPQPGPATDGHELTSISCPTARFCMAVGANGRADGTIDVQSPAAETFDGTAWTVRHPTTPAGSTQTELFGVSCPTATSCTAVGATGSGNIPSRPLAEHWDGRTWRVEPTADPGSAAVVANLFSVSCPSVSVCFAVGSTENGSTVPLAETWRSGGAGWSVTPTPAPVPQHAAFYADALYSLSCSSRSRCVAVGASANETGGSDKETNLVETWNGANWSAPSVPTSAAGSSLFAVSCSSATSCMATGQTGIDKRDDGLAMSLVLAGSHWSLQATPHLRGETLDDLVGVSCSAATACTAVGLENGTSTGTLAEHWNGSGWRLQVTPRPGAGSAMDSVSCAGGTCVATGSYGATSQSAFSEIAKSP